MTVTIEWKFVGEQDNVFLKFHYSVLMNYNKKNYSGEIWWAQP